MCNNSQRNVFLIQFMIMTVSIYTHLTMVWSDVGEKCDGQFLLNFYINENLYHRTKYLSFRKIELYENFGISVVYYLKLQQFYVI